MVIGTQQKNRRHLPRCLLQKIIHSDFLRRHYPHQVKGSKFRYFLSACFTSSPVFDCDCILHPLRTNCKRGQRRAQRCKTFFTQVLGRFTQVLLKKKVKYGIFKVDAARILFWSAPMIHEWTVAWALPLRVCAMLQSREAMQKARCWCGTKRSPQPDAGSVDAVLGSDLFRENGAVAK